MISDRVDRIKNYLGSLYQPLSDKEKELYSNTLEKNVNYYIHDDWQVMKKVACFLLLKWGRRDYILKTSYDLIDIYVGNSIDNLDSVQNITHELLIISHLKRTVPNQRLEDLICHLISQRHFKGQRSLILSEQMLSQVESMEIVKVLNRRVISSNQDEI